MSDVTVAPAPAGVAVPAPDTSAPEIWKHTPSGEGPLSPRDAARSLVDARRKRDAQTEAPAAPEAAAVEPTESAQAGAAPPQEVPSETQEAEPAELPPIEAPRSWTKDEKERFGTYPRELQAYLSEREQEREREFRRSQNEAAETRRLADAERQKAEQVRQEYESRLPVLLQTLQAQQAGEFADIKTQSDVMRMATEEPARYLRWDAYNKQLGAVQQQVQEAQQRQQQDQLQHFSKWSEEQDKLFAEKEPDILDPVKAPKLKEAAISELRNSGFTDNELASLWNGVFRDARVQLLINDAVKYRNAKQSVAKPAPKPIPPVHRPGTAPNKGAQQQAQIAAAAQKLTSARGVDAAKAGAELLRLQRQNAR
jgi:hypothetical protein